MSHAIQMPAYHEGRVTGAEPYNPNLAPVAGSGVANPEFTKTHDALTGPPAVYDPNQKAYYQAAAPATGHGPGLQLAPGMDKTYQAPGGVTTEQALLPMHLHALTEMEKDRYRRNNLDFLTAKHLMLYAIPVLVTMAFLTMPFTRYPTAGFGQATDPALAVFAKANWAEWNFFKNGCLGLILAACWYTFACHTFGVPVTVSPMSALLYIVSATLLFVGFMEAMLVTWTNTWNPNWQIPAGGALAFAGCYGLLMVLQGIQLYRLKHGFLQDQTFLVAKNVAFTASEPTPIIPANVPAVNEKKYAFLADQVTTYHRFEMIGDWIVSIGQSPISLNLINMLGFFANQVFLWAQVAWSIWTISMFTGNLLDFDGQDRHLGTALGMWVVYPFVITIAKHIAFLFAPSATGVVLTDVVSRCFEILPYYFAFSYLDNWTHWGALTGIEIGVKLLCTAIGAFIARGAKATRKVTKTGGAHKHPTTTTTVDNVTGERLDAAHGTTQARGVATTTPGVVNAEEITTAAKAREEAALRLSSGIFFTEVFSIASALVCVTLFAFCFWSSAGVLYPWVYPVTTNPKIGVPSSTISSTTAWLINYVGADGRWTRLVGFYLANAALQLAIWPVMIGVAHCISGLNRSEMDPFKSGLDILHRHWMPIAISFAAITTLTFMIQAMMALV